MFFFPALPESKKIKLCELCGLCERPKKDRSANTFYLTERTKDTEKGVVLFSGFRRKVKIFYSVSSESSARERKEKWILISFHL